MVNDFDRIANTKKKKYGEEDEGSNFIKLSKKQKHTYKLNAYIKL